ncbi:hypothetical protein SB394_11955 [Burkholderia sp. BCCIQ04A]|uniref:DUF86 domain-containing protein n=1 Tax=Burkholderia anthinoferrum TaxID=3090833 RepID=A0ABU5WP71_9BURK|nr:hypothetical protein [Burkholderia anthinoferrum]MEB2504627.1 hypothetical protein [Burkholderia anthinoferrum]MEB2530295.1 hypothetical protein [Burkholderia anthinoferrum]MEB2561668.1 hypothetical protein [Burkholderia anthinoferrum]MEB2580581.1 hypothetical protein [Burkholderia anthinoferrum]MEB2634440.1 hypothetical protein [Burkholderia anthinoferrum]
MEESVGIAAEQEAGQVAGHEANGAESDLNASGSVRLGAVDASAAAQAEGDGAVAAPIEDPRDIISEIEQLLRIVGNVAVHEFRRISERLADLKNHPAIKPGA